MIVSTSLSPIHFQLFTVQYCLSSLHLQANEVPNYQTRWILCSLFFTRPHFGVADIIAFLSKLCISLNSAFSASLTTFSLSLLRNTSPQRLSSAFIMSHLHSFPEQSHPRFTLLVPKYLCPIQNSIKLQKCISHCLLHSPNRHLLGSH